MIKLCFKYIKITRFLSTSCSNDAIVNQGIKPKLFYKDFKEIPFYINETVDKVCNFDSIDFGYGIFLVYKTDHYGIIKQGKAYIW